MVAVVEERTVVCQPHKAGECSIRVEIGLAVSKDSVVPSCIVLKSHVHSYCYNKLCHKMLFTRATRFLSPHMVVHIWLNDTVEIRHTYVRDSKWLLHTSHLRIQHAKNYFIPPQR